MGTTIAGAIGAIFTAGAFALLWFAVIRPLRRVLRRLMRSRTAR